MAKNKIVVQRGKEKRIVQPSMIPVGFEYVEDYKEPIDDYSKLSETQLKKVRNDDLKTFLDDKIIEYAADATKKDLIDLIVGE